MAVTTAMGLKDQYTQGHARRVSAYARRLAQRLRLPADQVRRIARGGLLHDVGKLALSDRIFSNAATTLSEAMRRQVRRHPIIGAAMLESVDSMADVLDLVLYHHERIDGTGYPFGLKGEQIPLDVRIVTVADCFDAITTDRPYQKHKSRQQAFGLLRQMAGNCLAQDLVEAFVVEIRDNGMTDLPISAPLRRTR